MKTFTRLLLINVLMLSMIYVTKEARSQGFYGRVGVGGGVGLCDYDPCDGFYDEEYLYPEYDRLTSVSYDPGTGFHLNIAAGYYVNKNIAVELGVKDFWGTNIKSTYTTSGEGGTLTDILRLRGMMVMVTPAVVLTTEMGKWDPYARFGMPIGIVPRVYEKQEQTGGNNTTIYEGVYKGGIPIGFNAALGVRYNISDNLDVYGEVNCNGINYSPKKYILKTYTENGVDELGTLSTYQKEVQFVRKYDDFENIPQDEPRKQLKETFPFSNVELSVGINMRF